MDLQALFKISHGVYLTGATDDSGHYIGSCIDSVMVVETDPQQVMVSMNNSSYTMENINKNHELALSILPQNTPMKVIELFGTHSSRDVDKWTQTPYILFHGLPVYRDAVAYMYLKVKETIQTSGHNVFLCDVVDGQSGNMEHPLIYAEYQAVKSQQHNNQSQRWICPICGYVYDGEIPFEQLPNDWVCPLCKQPKSVFVLES